MDEQMLNQALDLVESGQRRAARNLLLQIVEEDQTNERAWLWLVETLDNDQQRMRALERCLQFIPDSQHAQRGLEKLRVQQAGSLVTVDEIPEQTVLEPDIPAEPGPFALEPDDLSGSEPAVTVPNEEEKADQIEQELLVEAEDELSSSLEAEPVETNAALEDAQPDLDTQPVNIKPQETEFVEAKETPEIATDLHQKKHARRNRIALILGLLGLLVLISVIAGGMALSQYLWPAGDGSSLPLSLLI